MLEFFNVENYIRLRGGPRNNFSSGSLGESSGGENKIFNLTGSGRVLQIDDLSGVFCD
jgi:hypothetical protein